MVVGSRNPNSGLNALSTSTLLSHVPDSLSRCWDKTHNRNPLGEGEGGWMLAHGSGVSIHHGGRPMHSGLMHGGWSVKQVFMDTMANQADHGMNQGWE